MANANRAPLLTIILNAPPLVMFVGHSFFIFISTFFPRRSFFVGVDIKECFIIYAAFCGLSFIQLLLMMMTMAMAMFGVDYVDDAPNG